MNNNHIQKFVPPSGAIQIFPDTERYRFRFTIASGSSDNVYMVSFDSAPNAMFWTCSCFGNRSRGSCKHLEAMGLKGRKYGKNLIDAKKYGIIS